MKREIITVSLAESKKALDDFLDSPATVPTMEAIVDAMAGSLRGGGKVICCGNGGSLCDATHFAEELTGRFRENRPPLAAIAINDPAYMTCVGNDFSFGEIFTRQVEALGKPGDILLAISTSGNSANIVAAATAAHARKMTVVALTAEGDTRLSEIADITLKAPRTPHSDRIQEIHIKVIHIVIEALEKELGY